MEEYRPNSHKSKAERQKLEKVVSGTVRTKKKNEIRKLTDVFISEDIHSVKNYILMDVLVPAVKDAIEDIITNGIRMILRGDTGSSRHRGNASYVSYNKYSSDRREERRSDNKSRNGYSYDDFIFDNRGEAEDVLDRMNELIENYGMVSVADLYDLVGESGAFTNNKYGWTNLRNAEVVRVREGYMLKLPKAFPID